VIALNFEPNPDTRWLPDLITALNESKISSAEGQINLKLVDAAQLRALNKKYAGQDKVTDVLSFSYTENSKFEIRNSKLKELGDIAISLPQAERQARAAGTDTATEVATLALHGMLHILGQDHAQASQRQRMDQIQASVLHLAKLTYRNFNWV
jgi:probable rRNA maturation factor